MRVLLYVPGYLPKYLSCLVLFHAVCVSALWTTHLADVCAAWRGIRPVGSSRTSPALCGFVLPSLVIFWLLGAASLYAIGLLLGHSS